MIRYPNKVGKINLNDSEYGKSVLQRMNYARWKGTTSKVALHDGISKENELLFHHQIVEKVERYDIPDSLILNFHQTSSKYVPAASKTLAKRNSKQVCIKGSDDKILITTTFNITMDRKFLGLQLSLLRYEFHKDLSLSVNPKHYSNEKESLKLIDEIVLRYVTEERQSRIKKILWFLLSSKVKKQTKFWADTKIATSK